MILIEITQDKKKDSYITNDVGNEKDHWPMLYRLRMIKIVINEKVLLLDTVLIYIIF
jgi:hypothetical protein